MKLGVLSAILRELSFEEVIDFAAENGYAAAEIMCWPVGKAERRYAGVTHIDVNKLDDGQAARIQSYCAENGVEIATLGYYPNPLDPDPEKRAVYIDHIKNVIAGAKKLGVKNVGTFIGRDKNKSVDENFQAFEEIWPDIIRFAEKNDVRVCIENCPMYFSQDEWPGGNNLASSPALWRRMFATIDSGCFGLAYDPSHLVWQGMDYIKPLYDFRDKIFYVHLKDAKVFKDKIDEYGILTPPLTFHTPKLPGLGDIDWVKFISALRDVRYDGYACLEVEDKSFEDTLEDRKNAVRICKRFFDLYFI